LAEVAHAQGAMLWRWVRRRHPKKGRAWVKVHYYGEEAPWTFKAGKAALVRPDRTPITRFTKVTGRYSPYDPALRQYWRARKKRQGGRENYVKKKILLHHKQGDRGAPSPVPLAPRQLTEGHASY